MRDSILTVTVNPAIDKTYLTNHFVAGSIARASEVFSVCGGKGLNVLRVLNALEFDAFGTGMLGGWEGDWLAQALSNDGLAHSFYRIAGNTRMTHTIVDEANGSLTELREPGPTIQPEEAEGFLQHMHRLCKDVGHVTLSGSLAPGLDKDYYAKLARCAGLNDCRVYIDTSGSPLEEVLQVGAYLVKINEHEFCEWLGIKAPNGSNTLSQVGLDEPEILNGLNRLRSAGCKVAIVTLGAKGSYASDEHGAWRMDAPIISAVNTVGSGDAYLAGLVGGLSTGAKLPDACTLATAAAASNAMHRVAGHVDVGEIETLRPLVKATQVL